LKVQLAPQADVQRPPLRVGVVLSGGQASGGHNVITGLFDALKRLNPESRLFGFLNGPAGIIKNQQIELTSELLNSYRNQGGFDLIGSGRTKLEAQSDLEAAEKAVASLSLDGLVIIGGDDSNTNAALLAEYFCRKKVACSVVGVPKTIDGDLKNSAIEASFGFDTACKTYAELIGNLMRDALSAKKYYYFVKLMGRSASHIALECALQTHPNWTLIGEEVAQKKQTLEQLVSQLADLIASRAEAQKNYGVFLIPEGILEFIPEVKMLIVELNQLLAGDSIYVAALEKLGSSEQKVEYISRFLTPESQRCCRTFPTEIQAQLLIGRDAHGNVQVSKIETERLFIDLVKKELKKRAKLGAYSGSFSPQPFFLGYEGRACLPTNFDAQYCYALGHVAALLINQKKTGYICSIRNLHLPTEQWEAGAEPLTTMIGFEDRHGQTKPVIAKAYVDLHGGPFKQFSAQREAWKMEDQYRYPGPIQFFGPTALTDATTITLQLEKNNSIQKMNL
jgi:pyrophosphate--fructose-6-phosphate 1-phosphotransferase